jgi:hypothetical protein
MANNTNKSSSWTLLLLGQRNCPPRKMQGIGWAMAYPDLLCHRERERERERDPAVLCRDTETESETETVREVLVLSWSFGWLSWRQLLQGKSNLRPPLLQFWLFFSLLCFAFFQSLSLSVPVANAFAA